MAQMDQKKEGESLLFLDRPTLLFEHPEPAEAVALQPDHAPSRLCWRGQWLEITRGSGPERILTPWWQVPPLTTRSATRDYYKVQTNKGQWLWVFRETGHSGNGRWYVQGTW
jgi:protein ImuB